MATDGGVTPRALDPDIVADLCYSHRMSDLRDADPADIGLPSSLSSGVDPDTIRTSLLHRLDEVRRLCPDMRLGQLIATLGLLGEDATGRTLWDLEDEELAVALERFADDLSRRARG